MKVATGGPALWLVGVIWCFQQVVARRLQRARNATLKNLTAQIDIHTLADLLGYSAGTLANYAERSGAYMSAYVEAKRKARAAGRPIRGRFMPDEHTS